MLTVDSITRSYGSVELMCLLAPEPGILLMDEPLTNLDPGNRDRLLRYIKETMKDGSRCLIYVTHDCSEAEELSTEPSVMEGGRLI